MRVVQPIAVVPALLVLALLTGCVRVKPWEREKLAARCMDPALVEGGVLAAEYKGKLLETRTGGGVAGTAPGGGCGCTQ